MVLLRQKITIRLEQTQNGIVTPQKLKKLAI